MIVGNIYNFSIILEILFSRFQGWRRSRFQRPIWCKPWLLWWVEFRKPTMIFVAFALKPSLCDSDLSMVSYTYYQILYLYIPSIWYIVLTNPIDCISCGGGWLLWSNWNQRHVDETLKLVVDLVQTTCTLAVEYMEA